MESYIPDLVTMAVMNTDDRARVAQVNSHWFLWKPGDVLVLPTDYGRWLKSKHRWADVPADQDEYATLPLARPIDPGRMEYIDALLVEEMPEKEIKRREALPDDHPESYTSHQASDARERQKLLKEATKFYSAQEAPRAGRSRISAS
jgi:hypothetical protein